MMAYVMVIAGEDVSSSISMKIESLAFAVG